MAVQYIYDDMKGLENPLSHRAAEELKTAEIPEDGNVYGKFRELYRDLSIKEGIDWRDITSRAMGCRRARPGTSSPT